MFDQGKMLRNQAGIAFRALSDNRVGASVDLLILISRARLWNCNQGCSSVNLQSTEGLDGWPRELQLGKTSVDKD